MLNSMQLTVGLVLLSIVVTSSPARCQTATPSDEGAIRQTALDYIEGWYKGDAIRMERALHPELAKRMVAPDSRGVSV